ncbi:zinc finger, C2H2 type [Dictyocaulus viviparus]|uniref:Zinc finger, C2H2 type n=1 Tax=Dictyocaulus viviparus TaxID=29172 RepID=A0A0D8XTK9_DICVI|nr:zinc finger, C2H2 type [Dictyocaulus viviparus]
MLSMNSANRTVLQTPTLSNQLRNAIVSKGDGAIASSSETSSSSCSPSSIENLHQQRSLKHHDTSFNSAVVSILSHALKPEPSDADFTLGSNGSASLSALRMPAQQMPLHIGTEYGERCLDGNATSGAMSTTSGSSTPAPVRRSRPSHDGLLKCQFCPKKWADQNALHTHMTDCRMMRGHECAQCGKRFKARGGLQQHLRIHSNDRPYACHFCAKRFTQKSHVDQHERIHTGTKPFTCQFCGRAFRQRSQQLGHEATHSSTLASTNQSVTPSSQQLPASADQSKSQHNQEQEDVLRNEPSQPDQRIPDEQPPSAGEQFSLLALGQVPPSSTNTTVSSLLALNQGQMTTSAHGYHFSPSNYLHQGAAIGLLNGLH